jgi:hypothetical protein
MEDRRNRFKAGVDSSESRRRREESGVSVRKNKREEGLAKRRQMAEKQEETAVVLTGAAEASTNAGSSSIEGKKVFTVADIPALTSAIGSSNPVEVLAAVKGFRRVLSIDPNPPVLEVLAANVMPLLVSFLQCNEKPELQFESAWALTNIASTDQTKMVVEAGAVPEMTKLLMSHNADVREQCAWCLGNIAGDGPELRDYVLKEGALPNLLQNIMQPANLSMLRNAVWALSNFCRGKPQPDLSVVGSAIPVLAQVIMSSEDKEVLMDGCWAMSYLSDGENDRVQAVIDTGVVPRLVALLSHSSASVITPALRTVGNVVSGTDTQTQTVLDAGGLEAVQPLLGHSKKGIRKESCWMISNVAAGTNPQITYVLQHGEMVDSVAKCLLNDEWDVRKEAAWVISNLATGGSHEQVFALVKNHKVVPPLCSLLNVQDSKILMVAMDAIEALLKCDVTSSGLLQVPTMIDEADGLDMLEQLQEHENNTVYAKSVKIIETYFGSDDGDGDENVNPASNGNTFSFGVPQAPVFGASDNCGQVQVPTFGNPAQPLQGNNFNFNANNFNFNP